MILLLYKYNKIIFNIYLKEYIFFNRAMNKKIKKKCYIDKI